MTLILAIRAIYSTATLQDVGRHALAFWVARAITYGFVIAVWTAPRVRPRIWK
jgi:hypothetical protein